MKRNEYRIYSDKIKDNKNIAILSDVHISEKTSNSRLNMILDELEKIEPTHIVIPGDLYNVDKSTVCEDKVTNFVVNATGIADVFYVKGDIEDESAILNMSILPAGLKHNKNDRLHIFGEDLEELCCQDDLCITGIKLPNSFYKLGEGKKIETLLRKYFEYLERLSEKCHDDKFNVLLCHDPIIRDALKIMEALKDDSLNFDLVIAGHNHGGMMPAVLKEIIKPFTKDIKKYYPTYLKGLWNIDGNGYMIVSEGVTKYHSEMGVLEQLEKIHNGTVENVRVLKKD